MRSAILTASLLLTVALGAATAPSLPVLEFDPDVREVGKIGLGEPASAKFVISNPGTAELRMTLVPKNDGLVRPPEVIRVAPGQKATVTLTPDTWVAGQSTQAATYATNDPAHAEVQLQLKVTVHPFVSAEPGFARFNYVQQEKPGTISETLASTDGTPFKVLSVRSPYPWLKAEAKFVESATPDEKSKGHWIVAITIEPFATVGVITGGVDVKLDHPRQHALRIPVGGFVRPIFAPTPEAPNLGRIRQDQPLSQSTIDLQNFATEAIDIVKVTTDIPGLSATIVPIRPGHRYKVKVALTGEGKVGPFAGTILLKTNSPKQEWIDIPIRGEFIE